MTSPRLSKVASPSPLTMDSDGAWLSGTAAESVSGPVSLESAVTVLSMWPSPPPLLSMSAWVTVYVPVHVRLPPTGIVKPVLVNGAPGVPSQSSLEVSGSSIDTPVRVTLPVLKTLNS